MSPENIALAKEAAEVARGLGFYKRLPPEEQLGVEELMLETLMAYA